MSLLNEIFPPLSPPKLPFSLDCLPPAACLVGGAVRDALLKKEKNYFDLDFVLPQRAVETARKIASHYRAGFVVLDEQRQIARVVFPQGTIDFALQEGKTLEADLRRRDFTINAIAYNFHTQTLIDPLKGREDLEKKIIRMISPTNLEDDPLRLLRAYRQASQLHFTIEPKTRSTIRSLSPLIAKVAAERVQNELKYLFAITEGSTWLTLAGEDGLLKPWLETATPEKLQQLRQIDRSRQILSNKYPQIGNKLGYYLKRAKLACLVSRNPETAELELIKLKFSRAEIREVITAIQYLERLQQIESDKMSLREQYFFFLGVRNVFPILAVLAVALEVDRETLAPLLERYFNPQDPVAHPQPLVTGNDLIKELKIRPSPLIGKLLTEIQIARIEGKISTPQEALKFAASFLERQ